ncbi:MAG: hypothetical protein ACE15F_21310 [bacterium]
MDTNASAEYFIAFIIFLFTIFVYSTISYSEEADFSVALKYSGEWDSNDSIFTLELGNGLKRLDFAGGFWEGACNMIQMNPPKRGKSYMFQGKIGYPAVDFYNWGYGFDTVAIPNNQSAIDLINSSTGVAQLVWMKGRLNVGVLMELKS